MTQQQGTTISIVQGYCRVGQAGTWDEARDVLRKHVKALYWSLPASITTAQARDDELARIDGEADAGGYLMVSGAHAWADSMRYAREADVPVGIGAGDLAILQDYSNRCQWWTIAVKCKVLEIGSVFATIKITGQSCQLRQGEVISVPLSYLRPRSAR